MDEEQNLQEVTSQQPTWEKEQLGPTMNSKSSKKSVYILSFVGLACLALLVALFFYIANQEHWYKMVSSCGHTAWLIFFFFGAILLGGAVSSEAYALSRHRNILSICSLIIIVIVAIAILVVYSNMNSTPSGC